MDIRREWLIVVQALLVKEYLSSMTGAIDRIVNGLFHRLMRSTPIPVFVSLFVVQSIRADDPTHTLSAPASAISVVRPSASSIVLPRYALNIELHPQQRRVIVRQDVVWTNSGSEATEELVFQVVANNKLSQEMIVAGERTVESLRLDPRYSVDKQGRRFHLTSATSEDQDVAWR
ncbi:MAG: M1 family metallopeptidase, partial [Fuerstiella sp.]|nr:M1 family metallopeptidase [Fuerstiella sp.]